MDYLNSGMRPLLCLCLVLNMIAARLPADDVGQSQSGQVLSGTHAVPFSTVTIIEAGQSLETARVLGETLSDDQGFFTVDYTEPSQENAVLYLIADGEPHPGLQQPVRLATVIGQAPYPENIVINERTTVATAYSMAQFIEGRRIGGVYPGMQNSAAIVRNLVDLETGDIGTVLGSTPNGMETSALPTVNSLANLLSACVRSTNECSPLFELATPPDAAAPTNTLDAIVNIAHFPGQNVPDLLSAAQIQQTYSPALPSDAATNPQEKNHINSFVLALRYNGGQPDNQVLDGPGNIAIDSHGNAWINNNYAFGTDPSVPVCGSTKLIKLTPTGQYAPGSPFGGNDVTQDGVGAGGLYGAGFGIALDPHENVWVSNFGFQGQTIGPSAAACPNMAELLAVSVSQFNPQGEAISPDGNPQMNIPGGYTGPGAMHQPQGVMSDKHGNVWVAGCIDGTVTRFNQGNPDGAQFMKVSDSPIVDEFDKAFDVAIDHRGHAWVTGNKTSNVVEIDENFEVVGALMEGFDKPMGIASDSAGNLWVANAGVPNPPCPPALGTDLSSEISPDGDNNFRAAVSLITQSENAAPVVEKFTRDHGERDGLRWPWGIAVDGNDNVWVANFAGQRIMHMCGASAAACPPGKMTGDPISPDAGYFNNGLERVTAVQIDPSGNVWMTNNWILDAFNNPENPGGHEVVVFLGLAGPVKTPLLGPPQQPVPEPSASSMLLLGGIGLGQFRRRRQRELKRIW